MPTSPTFSVCIDFLAFLRTNGNVFKYPKRPPYYTALAVATLSTVWECVQDEAAAEAVLVAAVSVA